MERKDFAPPPQHKEKPQTQRGNNVGDKWQQWNKYQQSITIQQCNNTPFQVIIYSTVTGN